MNKDALIRGRPPRDKSGPDSLNREQRFLIGIAVILVVLAAFVYQNRDVLTGPMRLTFWLLAGLPFVLLFLMYSQATRHAAIHHGSDEARRQSDLRFSIVTRATNEAVWDLNLQNNVMWWNRGLQTLFAYEDDQVGLDHAWWVMNVHPEDQQRVIDKIQALIVGPDDYWSDEYRFRRADGVYAQIFDRGYVVRNSQGRAVRMIGAMQDITERKQEQEAMLARDAALESTRLKSQFLTNMSHEIRTPMNSIIGMTGLLLSTDLSPKQHEYANIVRFSGESLLAIINDILDFSKIEAGKLTFEMADFDLRMTVREATDLTAEQARAKKLKLSFSIPPEAPTVLVGDAGRLRQVLTNLLSNAIKFTPQGEVTIRVSSDNENATHATLRFEIIDTGIGMTEEVRERLFQPFSQGDASTTRKFGGTGLGLAICKQLVGLMAGQIGVDSVPGQGSVFWFTARFEKSQHPVAGSPSSAGSGIIDLPGTLPQEQRKAVRLLVTEDNVFNQKVIVDQLQQMGFAADVAANGIEALEALERIPYDLVLMDCQMPEMDGYEATEEIRRRQAGRERLPIIAMTAHAMKEERDKCLAAGMDDFVSKPVRVAHLEKLLVHWLSATQRPALDAAETGQETPGTAAVDMEIFMEIVGKEERIPEMAGRYTEQTREHLDDLRVAVIGGNAADVKGLAHKVAGSSAMCGMHPMVALLRELERMGHERQLADAESVFARVEQEFARIEAFFSNHRATTKTPVTPAGIEETKS